MHRYVLSISVDYSPPWSHPAGSTLTLIPRDSKDLCHYQIIGTFKFSILNTPLTDHCLLFYGFTTFSILTIAIFPLYCHIELWNILGNILSILWKILSVHYLYIPGVPFPSLFHLSLMVIIRLYLYNLFKNYNCHNNHFIYILSLPPLLCLVFCKSSALANSKSLIIPHLPLTTWIWMGGGSKTKIPSWLISLQIHDQEM